jgi:HlyD family secretion protein
MTRSRKVLLGTGIVVALGGIFYANLSFTRQTGVDVTTEKIATRDLEAIVTASGTIQPVRSVDVGASSPGRVVDLQVHEGDVVKEGQFLLQVDPRSMQIQADSQAQGLEMARSQLEETRRALENSQAALAQAKSTFKRQDDLFKSNLISKADHETAQNNLAMAQASVNQTQQSLTTQETRIKQAGAMIDNAQYNLSLMRITSPINGVVTKRSVEMGQMVTGSEFSPSVLVTVADMSVIRAEIEVDETDIPNVKIGQPAKVTIDALPDQTFTGSVVELGNSPIQAAGASATTRATDFKVKIRLDKAISGVRPGFTCSATITTATREKAVTVPIQAVTVREMVLDASGNIVHPEVPKNGVTVHRPTPAPNAELPPGQTRKEIEGVFVMTSGHAVFTPIKVGIAGEKYFEVLSGAKPGDEVITGPFASVRSMKDGDAVKLAPAIGSTTTASGSTTPVKS